MSGTRAGGLKARDTNFKLHGKDFYKKIGAIGGLATGVKGFARNPELAKRVGRKGGLISSRRPSASLEERRRIANKKLEDEA